MDGVEFFINRDCNVNYENKIYHQKTLLQAVDVGNVNLVKNILAQSVNVNCKNRDGFTPIYIATQKSNELFLSFPSCQDKETSNSFCEIIDLILFNGGDMHEVCNKDVSPFELALKAKNANALNIFASHLTNLSLIQSDKEDDTVFEASVAKGKASFLNLLLNNEVCLNYPMDHGFFLEYAIAFCHFDLVEVVLQKGADVNYKNNQGNTPLLLVCKSLKLIEKKKAFSKRNNLNEIIKAGEVCVKLLLEKGADVNKKNNDEMTPLHFAAESGNRYIVQELLNNGADINIQNKMGDNSLYCAIKSVIQWKVDIFRLLNNENDFIENFKTSLNSCKWTVQALIERGADLNVLNSEGLTAMHLAVESGSIESVKTLLSHDVSVNVCSGKGDKPLDLALKSFHRKFPLNNLKKSQGCSKKVKYFIKKYLFYHQEIIIDILLSNGAEVSGILDSGMTCLHYGVLTDNANIVKRLLDSGANVRANSSNICSPFLLATGCNGFIKNATIIDEITHEINSNCDINNCEVATLKVVKLLLDNGADINEQDNSGMSALHYAANSMNSSLVSMLLAGGSDVNLVNSYGDTPLHLPIFKTQLSNISCPLNLDYLLKINIFNTVTLEKAVLPYDFYLTITLLLKSGACMYQKNKIHFSPLQLAVDMVLLKNDLNLLNIFAAHNANFNIHDVHGRTPLINCVIENKVNLMRSFIQKGADINFTDTMGFSPLQHAISCDRNSIIFILLSQDVDVNSQANDGSTALQTAWYKSQTIFKMLIDHGANVSIQNKNGQTLLFLAVTRGEDEMVQLLLDKGTDPNIQDNDGKSCIFYARSKEMLSQLLCAGSYPNLQDNEGKTVLHYATKKGCTPMVQLLLKYGAEVDAQDSYGNTCLHYSFEKPYNALELVKTFISQGALTTLKNNVGDTALHLAVRRDYDASKTHEINYWGQSHSFYNNDLKIKIESIIELLLQNGADVNVANNDGETPLLCAIKKSFMNVVDMLIKYNVDINNKNNHAAFLIAINSPADQSKIIVEKLLRHGFHVGSKDAAVNCNLIHSAEKLMFPIVERLLDLGADVNAADSDGKSPLHMAAHYRGLDKIKLIHEIEQQHLHYKMAKLLLSKGALINSVTIEGETSLHYAVKTGIEEVVELLLENGANPNTPDLKGITSMHLNAIQGNENICKALIKNNALVNCVQHLDKTPLHLAVDNNNSTIVKILLENGAKIDASDILGNRPLHNVNTSNSQDVFVTLMEHYPNIDAENTYGYTPLHLACMKGCIELVKKLLDYGADIDVCNNKNLSPYDMVVERNFEIRFLNQPFCNRVRRTLNYSEMNRTWLDLEDLFQSHFKMTETALHFKKNFKSSNNEINNNNFRLHFNNALVMELKQMASEKIGNSQITFFDFLMCTANQLSRYIENEEITEVLSTYKFKYKFPLYGKMLFRQYWKGRRWNKLVEKTRNYLGDLFCKLPSLPLECIETIITYLSETDLRQVCDTMES